MKPCMKHIKLYEEFTKEIVERYSAVDLRNIVDILSNSIEDMDETDFADLMTDYGWDQEVSFEIYNSYWNIGAKDRANWGTKEWTAWLKKSGIKV